VFLIFFFSNFSLSHFLFNLQAMRTDNNTAALSFERTEQTLSGSLPCSSLALMLTSIGGLERGIDEWSAKSLQCFFWLEHCYFLGANHAGAMLESRESRNHRMAGVLRGWLFYCAGARCSGSSSRARWCSRGRRRGASPGMPSPGPTTRTDSCSAAPAAPPLDGAPPAAGLPARRPELPVVSGRCGAGRPAAARDPNPYARRTAYGAICVFQVPLHLLLVNPSTAS